MTNDTLIFLIGAHGSGKTTVARLLAERLGWSWLDADVVLEERAGRSIRAIFAEESEAGFRRREADVLAELCQLRNMVIATGGGVVLKPDNRDRLRAGLVVWLTADPEVLHGRICGDALTNQRRPPLAQGGLDEVREILQRREPLYRQCANLTLDTTNVAPEPAVESIIKQLGLTL